MTNYIVWPQEIDADFRAHYLFVTGEAIQSSPPRNDEQTHFMVGSSRLQGNHINDLLAEFQQIIISDRVPEWWVTEVTDG